MPLVPKVAEDLLGSLLADDPWYMSFLRLTPGVASSVFFKPFWHLAQTILEVKVPIVDLMCQQLRDGGKLPIIMAVK